MFLAEVGRPAEIMIEQSCEAAETALRGGTSLLPDTRPAKPNKFVLLGVNDSILITVMGSRYAGRGISSLAEHVNLLAKHVKIGSVSEPLPLTFAWFRSISVDFRVNSHAEGDHTVGGKAQGCSTFA
jgi:hypothetical protein